MSHVINYAILLRMQFAGHMGFPCLLPLHLFMRHTQPEILVKCMVLVISAINTWSVIIYLYNEVATKDPLFPAAALLQLSYW